ncbi:hypothetical protein ACPV2Q_004764, partial [Escherichia coli]
QATSSLSKMSDIINRTVNHSPEKTERFRRRKIKGVRITYIILIQKTDKFRYPGRRYYHHIICLHAADNEFTGINILLHSLQKITVITNKTHTRST